MRDNYFFASKDEPYHVSAGGVVYRKVSDNLEFAILYRFKDHTDETSKPYLLPKGTLYQNETLEAAALREIKEETGLDSEIENYLGAFTHTFMNPYSGYDWNRTTHYFLCKYVGGDESEQNRDPTEYFELKWMNPVKAIDALRGNPKKEHEIVERAQEFLTRESA